MERKEFCTKYNLTENQFLGIDEITGSLDLDSVTSLPDGFNPTVGGSLDLDSVTTLPDGFNPTVGGSLYLQSVTTLPDGFNPTVGGSLNLLSVTSLPDGFNPTVGDSLDLRSGLKSNYTKYNNELLLWQDGKYISADYTITEVISKKGNLYTGKKIGNDKIFYLYSDGKYHAHGDTPEKAKEDYRFKKIAEKLKKEPIKEDTIITIQYYRIITGACESGVKMWMQENGITKTEYKASELLPLLKKTNAYGLSRFLELITF